MKIIVAPDKFKGSLSASEVCEAIRAGILRVRPGAEVILHPLADGGEGSLDILADHLPAESIEAIVQDPLFRPQRAAYLKSGTKAYIEMARASGLPLLKPEERSAVRTTTFGTGQLIRNAVQRGARDIALFVGGSATNDAGIGMAGALGYRFLDQWGRRVKLTGGNLQQIRRIDAGDLLIALDGLTCTVVSDVQNPLFGEQGAAHVFAPQKGALPEEVALLDAGLRHIAELIERDLGVRVADLPGGGAAGGLGAGGVAFLGADIQSGIHTVIRATGLERHLPAADLIITGEGMLDYQSLQGKVVAGVAQLAKQHGIACAVIAGNTNLRPPDYQPLGIGRIYTVMQEGLSLERAIAEARERVTALAEQLASEHF